VKTLHDVLTVPSAAVQRGAPGTYVYVVGEDNKVAVRKVSVGPTDMDTTAITDGLKVGDKIVVDGADRLRDGAAVMVAAIDGKPQPGGAAPVHSGSQTPAEGKVPTPSEDPAKQSPGQHRRQKQGETGETGTTPTANSK
jgi:multidrug efflux system membrane fusion protein